MEERGEEHPAAREASLNGTPAGARLQRYLRGTGAVVLHHLRLPGDQREIDHLIVGPAAVTVVDARHYGGGRAKFEGRRLRIGRRNRTGLIRDVFGQADAVRELLADTPFAGVRVEAAIAVGSAGGEPVISFQNGRSVIVWGAGLIAREASRPGLLSQRTVAGLAAILIDRTAH